MVHLLHRLYGVDAPVEISVVPEQASMDNYDWQWNST